ncbi:MAG: AI-2E family transporter [Patescibacteria group bacterium]
MNEEKILDISWGTILKFALAALIFYTLYLIRDILILIVFSLIISVLFNPAIDFLAKRKIPRVVGTVLIYLVIFGMVGTLIYSIAPIFIYETQQFTQFFPQYFEKVAPVLKELGFVAFDSFESFTKTMEEWLVNASSSIFNAVVTIFGSIFSTITIFSIAIFLSLEEKGIEKALSLLFPKKYEANVLTIWERVQKQVSGWFGTRVLSCILVALMTFIACKILAVKYAISFSLLAGMTNIIPIVGPLIAGAIIVLFTLLDSWAKAIFILAVFILIQQIEGNIITPLLTKKIIGLSPVLVLIALLIGGRLWGTLGAILAIPLFGILFEFTKEFLKKKREENVVVL